MKIRLVIIGIIAVLIMSVPACTVAGPKQKSIEVSIDEFTSQKNITQQVELRLGSSLKVALGSNPSTGFSWSEDAQISDAAVLEQTYHIYIAPTGDLVGAPGQEVWAFEALKKGTATISMEYSRPWENGEQAEWTFELTVTVK